MRQSIRLNSGTVLLEEIEKRDLLSFIIEYGKSSTPHEEKMLPPPPSSRIF